MDYSKLTNQEIIAALQFHNLIIGNQLPNNWHQLIQTIKVEPGAAVAVELIDLYIADILYKQGIEIPPELNTNIITPEYYQQLAPVLYLPTTFTNDNLTRTKRIVRIIRSFINNKTPMINITPNYPIIAQQKIQIMPVIFTGPNKVGDFNWMIQQPQYNDVLFLFNDNESQFQDFIKSVDKPTRPRGACSAGGGNAIIRPYQCDNPPRAAGIPTGNALGGYKNLRNVQQIIEAAFFHIINLLRTGRYRRVAYSAGPDGRSLGTQIFAPVEEVKEYIVNNIENLAL